MPIDPNVLLLGLQPQAREPYDAPDVVAERQERVRLLREQAKAKQDAEYENQLYDWAVKSNLGPDGTPDFDAAQKSLYRVAPRTALKFSDAVSKARQQTAAEKDAVLKGKVTSTDLVARVLHGATADNWSQVLPAIRSIDPDAAAALPTQYDQKAVDAAIQSGLTNNEFLTQKREGLKFYAEGHVLKGMAAEVAAYPGDLTDTQANEVMQNALDHGATPADVTTFRNMPTPQLKPWANNLLKGPAVLTQEAGAAESRAETKRQNDLQEAARQRADADRKAAAEAKAVMDADLLRHRRVIETKPAGGTAGAAGADIVLKPGTANYRQAQDLADGTLTFQDFQRLHSRAQADAPLRAAIYDTARTLNPNFNPAAFEIGYRYASNPKVKSQIGSIKNVESGVPDLLKASDAATRSGATMLNQYAVRPIQLAVGSKPYTNFKTAITAFADELSGALGYGSATDMSREMGYDMTDMNQSPANFRSNVEEIVLPFVARKKASILGQMGPYADTANTAGKVVTLSELQAIARRKGTTVEQEKARATAAGYTVK